MGIVDEDMDEQDIPEECIDVQMRLYMYVHSVELCYINFSRD